MIDTFIDKYIEDILLQREEILAAFIAKYGCQPDEAIQIITVTATCITWTIKRKET